MIEPLEYPTITGKLKQDCQPPEPFLMTRDAMIAAGFKSTGIRGEWIVSDEVGHGTGHAPTYMCWSADHEQLYWKPEVQHGVLLWRAHWCDVARTAEHVLKAMGKPWLVKDLGAKHMVWEFCNEIAYAGEMLDTLADARREIESEINDIYVANTKWKGA